MKKLSLVILFFAIYLTIFSSPSTAAVSTPSISPVPVIDEVCTDGTIYPPNSKCYPLVNKFEVHDVTSSGGQFYTYPISCITAPQVVYSETYTGIVPPTTKTVNVTTDISEAQFGSFGPDSLTLSATDKDNLAKRYLFNALFDRPGTDPTAPKEAFRTFWRMLDSLSQAQLKAFYLENTDSHTYFYVGSDYQQHEVNIDSLKSSLPRCLKKYSDASCWEKNKYLDDYSNLNQTTKNKYDALLPFDFNNMRSYIVLNSTVSKENIPYLGAILSGLKGLKKNSSSVPGLFDYYTPDWAIQNVSQYVSANYSESLQYPSLILRAGNASCAIPANSSSLSSPKTYPDITGMVQTVSVPVANVLVSSTPNQCRCNVGDTYCAAYFQCYLYHNNPTACVSRGCLFQPGENTYQLTGSATGKSLTVFNNPYIDTITGLVVGERESVGSQSFSPMVSNIFGLANFSVGFLSKSQPSFFKMLLPSFAPDPEKVLISAPLVKNTTDNPNAVVSGSNTIYRENNLAQDAMHLLQNCWLVPSDQQSSAKCGLKPTGGVCDGEKFKSIVGNSVIPPSSAAESYFDSSIWPKLTPELIDVYSQAEKATGVPCEVLAGIHFEEGDNDPAQSLQDGGPLSGTLLESAIRAGQELLGKAGGQITDLDTLVSALSRYNGGGNSNCQTSGPCSAAASLTRCGKTVACATAISACVCVPVSEPGSCRAICGSSSFPWQIPYNYCSLSPKEGYDDPYVTDMWQSPQHDLMYLLYQYDCTQTVPVLHGRPGSLTVALSVYLKSNP